MMRICVIGAGAAGICAGRRLLEDAEKNGTSGMLEVRIFEQTDKIGGTWVLDEDEDEEEKEGIEKCQRKDHHSSMYHNLRANIPTVMMEYDDFPFPPLRDDQTSYLEHQEVLEYLLEFANPIQHLIQFNTRVLRVRKLANANCDKWEVVWEQKTMPSSSSSSTITKTATEQFDAIFVCTGHYSVPRFPPFIHKLEMPFIHSHDYKRAEHFGGKTVAVVGAGLSGSDIVKQLAKHAKKVYFLHMPAPSKTIMENGTMDTTNGTMLLALPGYPYFFPSAERPPNCEERCRVVDAQESTLMLADGTELGARDGLDCVIFCTGYKYSIPFLEAEGIVQCPEDGSFVSPIWAKFVHVHHPRSLFILGLPFPILPFLLFDCQMRLAIALIYGRVNPPELAVMLAEERQRLEELKEQGKPAKYFHRLQLGANGPFDYFDWLNQMAKQPKHRLPVHLAIYSHFRNAQKSTAEYRNVRYVIKNAEEFEVVQVPSK